MCLNQNSLKRAYAYYLEKEKEKEKQKSINLSEICDLIRENTYVYSLLNIKTILRQEKKYKYYEDVHELYSILNDIPRIPSVWDSPELDQVFALYERVYLGWSLVDHKKNYCINPTKMAECLLSIIQNGEHGLQILGENAKDQRVKQSLSILFTKSKL